MSPAASHSDRSSDVPARAARPPLPVSAAAFVSSLDRFAISPLLVLVALDLGATLAQSLTVASAYYLAYGLSQPVWGVLSDRFGRIRLMRATLLAAAIAGVVSALGARPRRAHHRPRVRRRVLRCGRPRISHVRGRHRR